MSDACSRKVSVEVFDQLVDFQQGADDLDEEVTNAQRDGSVSLYNSLCDHGVAYLADEVGMGKTYQALGVIGLLWLVEPEANVLVLAPSKAVQQTWVKTWRSFLSDKLKVHDNRLTDSLLHRPVHPACFCDNLVELGQEATADSSRLFVTRISSYSNVRQSLDARGPDDTGVELEAGNGDGPTPQDIRDFLRSCGIGGQQTMASSAIRAVFDACGLGQDVTDGSTAPLTSSTAINVEIARQMAEVLPDFDLVVLDEAHKMRNRGSNIMTRVFSTLLGFRPSRSDDEAAMRSVIENRAMPRLLSLSATPAHTSERDIYNVFAYRDGEGLDLHEGGDRSGQAARDYVEPKMVRRLRFLSGYSKYDYRRERGMAVLEEEEGADDCLSPAQRTHAELMVALVQKRLAHAIGDERTELTATIKTGFLETFESFEDPQKAHADSDKGTHDDIDKRERPPDWQVLRGLAREFAEEFGEGTKPPHPKLSAIEAFMRDSMTADEPEKLLVFVRRRASVRELARRVSTVYDEVVLEQLNDAYRSAEEEDEITFECTEDFRRHVHRVLLGKESDEEIDKLDEAAAVEDDEVVRHSRLLAAFRSKSDEQGAGYGFRNRFRTSGGLSGFFAENRLRFVWQRLNGDEEGICRKYGGFWRSLLSNSIKAGLNELYDKKDGPVYKNGEKLQGELLRDVVHHVLLERAAERKRGIGEGRATDEWRRLCRKCAGVIVKRRKGDDGFQEALQLVEKQSSAAAKVKLDTTITGLIEDESVWDCMRDRLESGALGRLLHGEHDDTSGSEELSEFIVRRDAVLDLLDKNLRMSEGIIDLFVAYDRSEAATQKENYAKAMARTFAEWLSEGREVRARRLSYRLQESVRIFEQLIHQVGVGRGEWFSENPWNHFEQQEPARDVMGGSSSRSRAISQFNSPFFPDFIAATSVFREGVDLHLSCRRVWQYGLPGSPGDLEQQSGRIDRYFSKVHRELMEQAEDESVDAEELVEEQTLEIGYPYVSHSIDATQLSRLLRRKLRVQPLMDRGLTPDDSSDEIDVSSLSGDSVQVLLDALSGQQASVKEPYEPQNLNNDGSSETSEQFLEAERNQLTPKDVHGWLSEFAKSWESGSGEVVWQTGDESPRLPKGPLMLLNRTFEHQDGNSEARAGGARDQPTVLSIRYDHRVRTHYLRLETPLGDRSDEERERLEELADDAEYESVELEYDEDGRNRGDVWRVTAVGEIELPFRAELEKKLIQLMKRADELEAKYSRREEGELADVKVEAVSPTVEI